VTAMWKQLLFIWTASHTKAAISDGWRNNLQLLFAVHAGREGGMLLQH